ncbi:MAG: NADP-dependent malic enzyme [Deltaproteobacteria bacterium]|nr:NADP-dependent malic enzyme [Deltaproteobacteria bacterium]
MTITREEALAYHRQEPRGKIEIRPTKPTATQRELSLAYSPGVAHPCLEIARDPDASYDYTARGNLVAVITNGTAVLGLGDIGAAAAKPVMEGKGVLFKRFADIDVFDLEIDEKDPQKFVEIVKSLGGGFGGINLEDIKAPECFYIESELRRLMDIPVFHDDQHGTAIITGAALLNGLELTGKKIDAVRVVFVGAGAAAIATARFYLLLGVKRENLLLTDRHGVVYRGRQAEMDPYKEEFAQDTPSRTLLQALKGADVLVGLSAKGAVTPEMCQAMGRDPILFTLANPDPEISYEEARAARPDAIIATGRSDYPNQVNNVLGFPFLFRGALDVGAREINEEMKLAAARALAALPREDTPDEVLRAYGVARLRFGPEYLIPTPFDPRVLLRVAPAVARAAIASGTARVTQWDGEVYLDRLAARQGVVQETSRRIIRRAAQAPRRRVVLPEAENEMVLRAAPQIVAEEVAIPVLVGEAERIRAAAHQLGVSLEGVEIVENRGHPWHEEFAQALFAKRCRKGLMLHLARLLMDHPVEFALMMVEQGKADCFVGGITRDYPSMVRPALQIIGTRPDTKTVSGFYMLLTGNRTLFLADTTVNPQPDAENLADIAIHTAQAARFFGHEPRVAFLSYSNFGSVSGPDQKRIWQALELVRQKEPGLAVDGEMQGHFAVNAALRAAHFPFSNLNGNANVLVFPNLHAANTAYRLLSELSEAEILGPVIMGLNKPVNLLSQESLVTDVVNMAALSVLEAQEGVL